MQIKLSTNFPGEPIIRQTPGRLGRWKDCNFLINDPSAVECDIWVVLEGLAQDETAFVKSGITIFFAFEPPATEEYQRKFLNQFDLVIASHQKLRHRNFRNEFQGLPWHAGLDRGAQGDRYRDPIQCTLDYDRLAHMSGVKKTALMSVIASTQSHVPGHRDRLRFIERLKHRWGDRIEIYGRGIRPIADKFDAIAPYKYNVVLENSATPHYWSEKLADCFLAFAYPIYWGCPNVFDYFPEQSITTIDISRPDDAIEVIEQTIGLDLATTNESAVLRARKLVLERYNTFDVVRRACLSVAPKEDRVVTLRPDRFFFNPYSVENLAKRVPRISAKLKTIVRDLL
jgi:glycosyl transferase family 10 (putative fucosyltransferase)